MIPKKYDLVVSELEEKCKTNKELARRDAINDNGSTPTSHNTATQMEITSIQKKNTDSGKNAGGQNLDETKLGPKFGHVGKARKFDPDRIVDRNLFKHRGCGGALTEIEGGYWKSIIEIIRGIIVEEHHHVKFYWCERCRKVVSTKPSYMIDGTSIGKKLLIKIAHLTELETSESGYCTAVKALLGLKICRNTMREALAIAAKVMKPEYEKIHKELSKSSVGNPDEIRYPIGNKTGWLWVCIGDNQWVFFHFDTTRGKSVITNVFSFPNLKVTCDAYAVYKYFEKRQLCWAHVKTKVRNDVAKKYSDAAQYLQEKLSGIFHYSKTLPKDTPQKDIDNLIKIVKFIGKQFQSLGLHTAGTYVINCADNLFTFVKNPEMSETNNLAERTVRPKVIKRKISQRFATIKGAKDHAVIASCMQTWKLQKKDPEKELHRLFYASDG